MKKNMWTWLIVTAIVVAVDQITKSAVISRFSLHESHPVINGFFNLVYVLNPGAAFGFMARASETFRMYFFIGITVAVILMILFYLLKSPADNTLNDLGMTLIFSGAVGNLLDRVRFGAVVDFLDFYVRTWHWPAFNVADSAITVGAGLMIWGMVVRRKTSAQD